VPKMAPLSELDAKCGVGGCVLEHEMSHIRDFKPFEKRLCRAFGPHEAIQMTARPQAQSEANAYQVSVDCLNRLLRDKDCDQGCKARLRQLIADAERRRDEWKSEVDRLR